MASRLWATPNLTVPTERRRAARRKRDKQTKKHDQCSKTRRPDDKMQTIKPQDVEGREQKEADTQTHRKELCHEKEQQQKQEVKALKQ